MNICSIQIEPGAMPLGCYEKLSHVAMALAIDNHLDRNGAAKAVRMSSLFAHVGGRHVAICPADGQDRIAIITGSGPDWD